MNRISDELWKQIENWGRGKVSLGFRFLLEDVVQCFYRGKRATPGESRDKWKSTLSELEKIKRLSSSLNECLENVGFDAWRAFFGDCPADANVKIINEYVSSVSEMVGVSTRAVDAHRKNKDTQKNLNHAALDVIVSHIDDAYFRHTGNHLARGSCSPQEWLVPVVSLIDRDFLLAPTAIDNALKRLIFRRRSKNRAGSEWGGANLEGAIFKLGCRYLEVRDDFDDAVGCDVLSSLEGVGGDSYMEIAKNDLWVLELVRQPHEGD
ncbi:hypothetical protein [Magnetospirillum sp. 64-120]|uniref:hypothetical protein n=1 Tax=Magnetospirillum sp. 64-120 TaxID=1895778 RepID=UPI0025C73660|nr:hypothetical protein [Magnetospirillum sp. 64-120]